MNRCEKYRGYVDHVLAEVFFAKHRPDVVISWLTPCYAGKVATPSGFWWDGDAEGNAWVVADAAACRYLGCTAIRARCAKTYATG